MADLAPLQLYASAVTFAPQCSLVKADFIHCMPRWLIRPPATAQTWRTDVTSLQCSDGVYTICFSSNDDLLAACSGDGVVRIWNVETGVCVSSFKCAQGEWITMAALAFSKCDILAIACVGPLYQKDMSETHILKVTFYDTANARKLSVVSGLIPDISDVQLAFRLDNENIVDAVTCYVHPEQAFDLWRFVVDVDVAELIWTQSDLGRFVYGHSISMKHNLVALHTSANTIGTTFSLISLDDGKLVREVVIPAVFRDNESIVCHISRGTNLTIATEDGTGGSSLYEIDIQTAHHRMVHKSTDSMTIFAMAHGANKVASSDVDSSAVQLRDLSNQTAPEPDSQQHSKARDIQLADDGNLLFVAYSDRIVVQTIQGSTTAVLSTKDLDVSGFEIMVSLNGAFVAAPHGKGHGISIWHVPSEKHILIPGSHLRPIAFSHEGRLLAYRDSMRLKIHDLLNDEEKLDLDLLRGRIKPSQMWFVFAEGENTLLTSHGSIHIDTGDWDIGDYRACPPVPASSKLDDKEEDWVSYDGTELLWLPEQYRADFGFEALGSTIVGLKQGKLITMQIVDPNNH